MEWLQGRFATPVACAFRNCRKEPTATCGPAQRIKISKAATSTQRFGVRLLAYAASDGRHACKTGSKPSFLEGSCVSSYRASTFGRIGATPSASLFSKAWRHLL